MEGLMITKAGIADAAKLTELSVTTFVETFAADNRKEDMDRYIEEAMSIAKITEELLDRDSTFFIARYHDEVVGYAKVGSGQKTEAKGLAAPIELERIYVLKQYAGMKLGAALMELCVAYATAHGHKTMWLGVWEHNHRAVKFYKQWGFEFFGSHPFRLGNDIQTDQLMKKAL